MGEYHREKLRLAFVQKEQSEHKPGTLWHLREPTTAEFAFASGTTQFTADGEK